MLQLIKISKKYKTGTLVQRALDGVTLNFRDNEFVSVLGPSGSGKSTLLNIIGGLDRYDNGELIIDGVSTKKYKDSDWDSYRNHTIGFVFQSYNLISHQTILSNVELALTISGIPKSKRKSLALDALDKVGLKEQAHKKPNQLSGGQMQRVAIARALVNNPSILLADEPTGALDSETSVQVMELLKEVAKDRLVIMVTHNPDLAYKYSTRIVELYDGKITSDSDPYKVKNKEEAVHRNFGKASMSYLTSISLSFNNLKTKFKRTVMVAFAGSIGIIGIALILALSNGVNKFIHDTEEETMISYPIQITKSSFSIMSGMTGLREDAHRESSDSIAELKTLENMLSVVNQNDLGSLKKYFEEESNIHEYTKAIEYSYNIDPIIFVNQNDKYIKVNPNESFSSMGISSGSVLLANNSINAFNKLPNNESLYKDKFSLLYGRWPKGKNECVLVTDLNGNLSDFIFYSLGLKDQDELTEMIENFANNRPNTFESEDKVWEYDEIVGLKFKVTSNSMLYSYDDTNNVYIDKSTDNEYIEKVLKKNGIDLEIVGIIKPGEQEDMTLLRMGIWYNDELVESLRDMAANSAVVKAQRKNPNINVLTNGPFGETTSNKIDFKNLFSINEKKMMSAFNINQNKIKIDTTPLTSMDFTKYFKDFKMSETDEEFIDNLDVKVDQNKMNDLIEKLTDGYLKYASKDPSTDYMKLPDAVSEYIRSEEGTTIIRNYINKLIVNNSDNLVDNAMINDMITSIMSGYQQFASEHGYNNPARFNEYLTEYLQTAAARNLINEQVGKLLTKVIENTEFSREDSEALAKELEQGYTNYARKHNKPDPSKMQESFFNYLSTDEAKKIITEGLYSAININEIKQQVSDYSKAGGSSAVNKVMDEIKKDVASKMQEVIISSAKSLPNAISIDTKKFASAFVMNLSEEDIKAFFAAMASNRTSSFENNLVTFGYAGDYDVNEIDIYAKDFESKSGIINVLDSYNEKVAKDGSTGKEITYTDVVGIMLASVTTIVNVISYVLIAFVGISLVVSSIMIGVITYISVLERRKEIGILRAMGASKKNVSQIFTAETGIIGLFAGILGVVISILITIPANIILRKITDIPTLTAYLTVPQMLVLITISVVLTLIGGIIPSKGAAKQDPVEALRTE